MNTLLTLHNPAAARSYYERGIWRQHTFYTLLRERARQRPDGYALRDGKQRLTWTDLLARVDAQAEELRQAGVRRGQRVSVWLPNCAEIIILFLACSRNGYVCNFALHHNYTGREVMHLIERIDTTVFVTRRGHGADGAEIDIVREAAGVKSLRRLYLAEPGQAPVCAWESGAPVGDLATPEPCTDPDKIVCLSFTSGTTGAPKGVLHSDNTLLANGRDIVGDWRHDHTTILLCLSPLSHAIGFFATSQMMSGGFELVVNDPYPGMNLLDWIIETRATYVMGVPTHAIDIIAEKKTRGMEKFADIRIFYMGGSSIPQSVAQTFIDAGVMPLMTYGMTESGGHQYTRPDDPASVIVETCGRVCNSYEVKIFDQENRDREVGPGVLGEIGGRGGLLMLGYFDDQKATENAFNLGGWFMSGDLGTLDENGCLRVLGRKKDLIIRGGRNIHPAPIENLVVKHPAVSKAAGFPIADARLGEKFCLAVIAEKGASPTGQEMLEHLNACGLSKFDMPEYFIVLTEFPMTAGGKILKRELVEWAKSGRIAPQPIRWADPNKAVASKE